MQSLLRIRCIGWITLLSWVLWCSAVAATSPDDPFNEWSALRAEANQPSPTLHTVPRPADFPLLFIPNQGQWDDAIRYTTRAEGMDVLFTPSEVILQVHSADTPAQPIRLRPLDAPAVMPLTAGEQRPTRMHYFIGQDPSRWQADIPTYASIRYHAIQPGVDWLFRNDGTRLVYDLEVAPGADPAQIRLVLDGVTALEIDADGALRMTLPDGQTLLQHAPCIYQDIGGERVEIEGQFVIFESHAEAAQQVFGFQVGDYDPTVALVIDPTLEYSTLVGGDGDDEVTDIAVTASGQAVVVGSTLSDIATLPPYSIAAGSLNRRNALIYALNPAGNSLDYVVLLGGSADDQVNSVVLDEARNAVYLTGHTRSDDLPTVNGLYQVLPGGRAQATFVAKLDTADGSVSLDFATYFGGTGVDSGVAIGFDEFYLYVAGDTASADMPVRNAPYPQLPGGSSLFLLTLSLDGQDLHAATYFGGSRNDNVKAMQVVYDTGDIYLAGITASTDFPDKNALQDENSGGTDGFITHIAPDWQELVFSTYFGGRRNDVITDMVLDQDRNLLISGYTNSTDDFPIENALYLKHPGNNAAFVSKLDKFGRFLHFSTHLGGLGDDQAHAIAVDQSDAGFRQRYIHVAGETQSNNFPVVNAEQFFYAGNRDGFVIRLDFQGQRLLNASFFGGTDSDRVVALATASAPVGMQPPIRNIFMAGNTESVDFPASLTQGAPELGRVTNQFVARLDQGATTEVPALELRYADVEIDPEVEALAGTPVELTIDLIMRNNTAAEIASFSSVLRYDPDELEYVDIDWNPDGSDDGYPSNAEVFPTPGETPETPGQIELLLFQDVSRLVPINDLVVIARLTFAIPADQLGAVDDNPPGPSKNLVLTQENTTAVNTNNRSVFIEGLTGNVVVRRPCNTLVGDCDCSGTVRLAEVQAVPLAFFQPPPYLRCMKVPTESLDLYVVAANDLQTVVNNYLNPPSSPDSAAPSVQRSVRSSKPSLVLSSPREVNGALEIDLVLDTAGQSIAALTSDIYYDPSVFSPLKGETGPAASAARKNLSVGIIEPGHLRVLIYGLNQNPMNSGIVGTLTLHLTPERDLDQIGTTLRHTASAATPDADALAITAPDKTLGNPPPPPQAIYVTTFMETLAGSGVTLNPSLQPIFARILERQLTEQAGNVIESGAFGQLVQVFTFVASPPEDRPLSPLAYDNINAARNAAKAASGSD